MDSSRPSPLVWLFTAAIFVGSALLFLVQPMVAKMLLPAYGGTPGVWNTSMVFFQAALLLGYGYAHLSYKWLGPKVQPIVHLGLMGAAAVALPVAFSQSSNLAGLDPATRLLMQLAIGVGIPFFAVSAGAPLLQRWYAATGAQGSNDPFFLYAASNAASILALLAYPLVFEPLMPLMQQSFVWTVGFGILAVLVLACAAVVLGSRLKGVEAKPALASAKIPSSRVLYWIALSFVPSSLLLGVTTYLTTNIASAPLLWVIPLVLYLLTFVLAFSAKRRFGSIWLGRLVSMLLAPMVLVIVLEATDPIIALGAMHLIVFTLGALMCHTRLNETRPEASDLTAYYFWISVGGVLGGIFNALIAPVLFDSVAEYSIALVALILLVPREKAQPPNWVDFAVPIGIGVLTGIAVLISNAAGLGPSSGRTAITLGIPALLSFAFAERPVRYGLAIGAVFLASKVFGIGAVGQVILTERSFFGVHRVLLTDQGRFRELMHGNTIHGKQSTDASKQRKALTYYYETGPIGQVFAKLQAESKIQSVGLVGMGVGSLATYGKEGQRFDFYEIDPDVVYIARDSGLFSFLSDSPAEIDIVLGDARLSLEGAKDGGYNLMVLDAFSSDSIPTHLLTVEALRLYKSKLTPNGLIAFHISNRYLELEPVLGAAARQLGMVGLFQDDLVVPEDELLEGKFRSSWAVLAASSDALADFEKDVRWAPLKAKPSDRPWTDDFSNLVEAFLARQRDTE